MLPEIFSNKNFSVLVSEGMINLWNEFELTRKNFVKSKDGIVRLLKHFNSYFSREIGGILIEKENKIIFNNLNLNKNNLEQTYIYFNIKKEREDYICEFCNEPYYNLTKCHIIRHEECNKNSKFKNFDSSVINRLFMCPRCDDITERRWQKPKKLHKKFMNRLLKTRLKLKSNIIKDIKSDISKYKKGIKLIDTIKKEIENYKKQERILNEKFNEKKKELIYKIKKEKNKISKEVKKSKNEIRKKSNSKIDKLNKRYKNPKIKIKKLNKIRKQREKDINKKEKVKKEKHRRLDKIKKQEENKMSNKEVIKDRLYKRFQNKVRKIVKSI